MAKEAWAGKIHISTREDGEYKIGFYIIVFPYPPSEINITRGEGNE